MLGRDGFEVPVRPLNSVQTISRHEDHVGHREQNEHSEHETDTGRCRFVITDDVSLAVQTDDSDTETQHDDTNAEVGDHQVEKKLVRVTSS